MFTAIVSVLSVEQLYETSPKPSEQGRKNSGCTQVLTATTGSTNVPGTTAVTMLRVPSNGPIGQKIATTSATKRRFGVHCIVEKQIQIVDY